MRSWLCGLLCAAIMLSVFPLGVRAETKKRTAPRSHGELVVSENLVAAGDTAELYLDADTLAFAVYVPSTGAVFGSTVDTALYTEEVYNRGGLRTLLSLTVAGSNSQEIIQINGASGAGYTVRCESVKNGVRLNVRLTARQIGLSVVLTLNGDVLTADIPADSLAEDGEYMLLSAALFPLFGAARGEQDGYLFFPDGSGSLITCKQSSGTAFPLILPFYGDAQADEEVLTRQQEQGIEALTCPVYGIKADDAALFAIVTAGSADASLYLAPGGYIYKNLFRSYVQFHFRSTYPYTDNAGATQYAVDSHTIKTARTVEYRFLTGDAADYCGMASAYRAYILSRYGRRAGESGGELPLLVDLFMGVGKDGFLFRRFVSVTTFDQAQTILTDLKDAGVGTLQAELLGWSAGGYDAMPTSDRPARQLGGSNGLSRLAAACREQEISLTLQYDLLLGSTKAGSFNARKDTVRQYPGTIVSSLDGLWQFLTGRAFRKNYVLRPLTQAERLAGSGFSLGNVGRYLFGSYSADAAGSRRRELEAVEEGLSALEQSAGYWTRGGSIYAVARAKTAVNLPDDHSGYIQADRAVPFYELVLHGVVPYTTTAANNAYDVSRQILRWAEMGALPYFELTYESSEKLRGTAYAHLLSSQYSQWKDTAVSVWKQFNADFAPLAGVEIVGHTALTDTAVRVTYKDGTRVYVNYAAEAIQTDGVTVPAEAYIVVREGEQSR